MSNVIASQDFMRGTVDDNPLTSGATTLNSTELSGLTITSGETKKIVLDPAGDGNGPEIVYATAKPSSTSATITRGREGTSAVEHALGTVWRHVPTARDFSPSVDRPWGGDPAEDYEFDAVASSPPGGWAWLNQGGATYAEEFGVGAIAVPAAATTQVRGIIRAIPVAASWEATAKLTVLFNSGTAADAGLVLYASSTGEIILLRQLTDANLYVTTGASVTSLTANPASYALFQRQATYYMRIRQNSTTDFDFEVSFDGVNFVPILSAYDPTAHQTTTDIGFYGNSQNSAALAVSCHWFRIR